MSLDEPTYRCRADLDGQRCDYRGTHADLAEHADAAGHPRCVVIRRDRDGELVRCARVLGEFEQQTCERCVERVRDDLDAVAVAYTHLERKVREGAYRGGWLTALVILGDGSTSGGGPDDDIRYRDPCSAAAQLEACERDWRDEFGHPPYPPYPPLGAPRRPLHVFTEALAYLRLHHRLAARTHRGFDDYAAEIHQLRGRLEHVVALALDPVPAPIPCGCGGRLEQHYRPCACPRGKAHRCGLSEDRVCRSCGTVYPRDEFLFRMRMLTEMPGWVSVEKAAQTVDRPLDTVWAWVTRLDEPAVPSACNRLTRRVLVELDAVVARSDVAPRTSRRSA